MKLDFGNYALNLKWFCADISRFLAYIMEESRKIRYFQAKRQVANKK